MIQISSLLKSLGLLCSFRYEWFEILFVEIIIPSPITNILHSHFEVGSFKIMYYMPNIYVPIGFWEITITLIP